MLADALKHEIFATNGFHAVANGCGKDVGNGGLVRYCSLLTGCYGPLRPNIVC